MAKDNESTKFELKQLSNHFRYAFLEENSTSLAIISLLLTKNEKDKLLKVLCEHKPLWVGLS